MQVIGVVGEPNHLDQEDRFKKEADNFTDRLVREFGFFKNDIVILGGGLSLPIKSQLEIIFLEKKEKDILLYYLGHGQRNGWGISGYADEEILAYENLRLLLALHHGNLIFLNDCCYALAAEETVLSRFGDYLLIGSSPANELSYSDLFLDRVLNCWRRRKRYGEWIGPHISGEDKLCRGNENLSELMYRAAAKYEI